MPEELKGVPDGTEVAAHSRLLLEAAETINSSLDSPALETTILGEAARLTGADASALLVSRGDVLVAQGQGDETLPFLLTAPQVGLPDCFRIGVRGPGERE